jgi:hypothetical protein
MEDIELIVLFLPYIVWRSETMRALLCDSRSNLCLRVFIPNRRVLGSFRQNAVNNIGNRLLFLPID